MELFAYNEEVNRMEAMLPPIAGLARLLGLLELAWHLRQRDTRRALHLAAQALELMDLPQLDAELRRQAQARILLVQGEAAMLGARLEEAGKLASEAFQICQALQDDIGIADAHLLQAWVASHGGRHAQSKLEIEAACHHAALAQDSLRQEVADAMLARFTVFREPQTAQARWGRRFTAEQDEWHAGLQVWINDFLGIYTGYTSDFAKSIVHFMRSHEAALATGQIRSAIIAATNLGNSLTNLNDHHAALEWMQRGLDLARKAGWEASIGACLMQTGETLRQLGQLDAARELLDEAMQKLKPLSASRNYTIALKYYSDIALARGEYAQALQSFRQLEENAALLGQADFQSDAWRGQAHALSRLGQAEQALQIALAALEMARDTNDAYCQVSTLQVLADIHAYHQILPPYGMTANSTALHYLQQALDVAATIEGFTVPGDLLDMVASEYARMDEYEKAYEVSLQAIAAREKTHSAQATNRAIAMQVRYQTEQAQAEGEQQRQLASSEAKRAEALQQHSATLEHLGAIGQEITAHLDSNAVFAALKRHVESLLDVTSMAVFLLDADGQSLVCRFGEENGKPIGPHVVMLTSPVSYAAQCVRERRELLIDMAPDEHLPNLVPGTLACLSKLFAPLVIGERILGVMTVQTPRRFAYDERERLIFRSLCAYGAIALGNAHAYRQLQGAQQQLVAQEKLAALGSLVAGVAHELNSPIGNSLMIASSFQDQTDDIRVRLERQQLRHAELVTFLQEAQEASTLILRGLTNAADLVNSFKQVAVDRTTAQRRCFDLAKTCHEIVATMMSQIRSNGHQITLDIPAEIKMTSYPGPLGQVLTNLINNAMLHGFDGMPNGQMKLLARQDHPGRVMLQFSDNGRGIPPQHKKRIFDPFFTTKLGQGGTGLGLSISYNIVSSLLHGHLQVQSEVNQGTVFMLDLPLTAPEQELEQSA
ncbi:ATP-binding protein [Massilia sp. W12]|uniref:ATP-binding protein n=1 Tax=Massilia sp. W12 TaxID=3126507 RepID=UPI0030CE5B61